MGNAAGKEYNEATVEGGSLQKDESLGVHPTLVSHGHIKATSKGKSWINADTAEILWKTETKGLLKSHSLVKDSQDEILGVIITEKSGITTITNWICRSQPTYKEQPLLTAEELKKAGIAEGEVWYKFSKIDTTRQMTTAHSEYSVLTGPDSSTLLYTADKLSAMAFMATFKEGDQIVAKATTHGISMTPTLEAAAGVDLLAMICMGTTLVSNDFNAGALAGAGVI